MVGFGDTEAFTSITLPLAPGIKKLRRATILDEIVGSSIINNTYLLRP